MLHTLRKLIEECRDELTDIEELVDTAEEGGWPLPDHAMAKVVQHTRAILHHLKSLNSYAISRLPE
jgi:hypothetical protein